MDCKTLLAVHPAHDLLDTLVPLATLARGLGARLTVLVLDLGPPLPATAQGLGPSFDPAFDWSVDYRALFEATDARAGDVRARLRDLGVEADVRGLCEIPPAVPDAIATHALCTDLVVLTGSASSYTSGLMAQALGGVLFDANRPALLLRPDRAPVPGLCGRVTIGWDGSPRAVRAIERALPFLVGADEVEAVTVGPIDRDDGARAKALHAWLDAHGVETVSRVLPLEGRHVRTALLEHVHESAPDLLVTGAWGHARLRERLFAGTTHALLSRVEVPMLLAR